MSFEHTPSHAAANDRTAARIALLGCGSVGAAVAQRLVDEAEALNVSLVSVLVRDLSKDRGLSTTLFTDNIETVLGQRPDLVIEVLGGLESADAHVSRCLEAGVAVVSANKTLIANRLDSLSTIANRTGTSIAYEAAVCSAVPVLAALAQLNADRVTSITAIVNGTCNFILSEMTRNRLPLDAALEKAKGLGLAEPDPSADLSGWDSSEKLCLLARAAGVCGITPDMVEVQGIECITEDDIRNARSTGHVIRLVAQLDRCADGLRLRVSPTLVARSHPLACVEGEDNGIVIETIHAGELFLRGKGAGPGPTASAILGDVVRLLGSKRDDAPEHRKSSLPPQPTSPSEIRLRTKPGTLSPRVFMDAVAASDTLADEITLSRTGASVRTHAPEGLAALLEQSLESSPDILVMPILECVNEPGMRSSA
jgi:homoserine dehydrogenase